MPGWWLALPQRQFLPASHLLPHFYAYRAPYLTPGPPHSYVTADSLRPAHLRLTLQVDFASRTLAGAAIWWLAGSALAAPAELVLDTRDLTIEGVMLGDAPAGPAAAYTLGPAPDPVLGSALRIAVPAGTVAVREAYRTQPGAAALQWLALAQTAGQHPFLFTQSQTILARTWVPCPDSPGIRFSYEAEVEITGAERGQLLALMSATDNHHTTPPTGATAFGSPSRCRPTCWH